ncbi:MAG: hypothetical protein KF774_18665 [Planctomyces sp.]|nr:hypothetical protein [Planctomyces sp.]
MTHGGRLGHALLFAAVAVVAAVAAVLAIRAVGDRLFVLPPELARLGIGRIPSSEEQRILGDANLVLTYKHFVVWMSICGALLGGALAAAHGILSRASARQIVIGVAISALVAAAFGAASGPLTVKIDHWLRTNLPSGQLTVSDSQVLMMHAAAWCLFGAGVGLAFALGAPRRAARDIAGGLAGGAVAGLLGGLVFAFLIGVIDPMVDPSLPMPEATWHRVLWLALPFALIGLALGRRRWPDARAG